MWGQTVTGPVLVLIHTVKFLSDTLYSTWRCCDVMVSDSWRSAAVWSSLLLLIWYLLILLISAVSWTLVLISNEPFVVTSGQADRGQPPVAGPSPRWRHRAALCRQQLDRSVSAAVCCEQKQVKSVVFRCVQVWRDVLWCTTSWTEWRSGSPELPPPPTTRRWDPSTRDLVSC